MDYHHISRDPDGGDGDGDGGGDSGLGGYGGVGVRVGVGGGDGDGGLIQVAEARGAYSKAHSKQGVEPDLCHFWSLC